MKIKIFSMEAGAPVVVLNAEDARDAGLYSKDRVKITTPTGSIIAIVDITKTMLKQGEVGVFLEIKRALDLKEGQFVSLVPVMMPRSLEFIKKKMQGKKLEPAEIREIVEDVVLNKLSESEISAFLTSVYIYDLDLSEIESLARAIAETGERLEIKKHPIFDKHSIGGVAGNKISLLIVPIVAAAGLTIPKTSSRAITSCAGTADIMEVLAPVDLTIKEIQEIVEKINGVIVWGGAVNLAPADDIFIKMNYPFAIDPRGQTLASVLAKKYAVGAEYVVIDIPTGPSAKVENMDEAKKLARDFVDLGERLGMHVECAITYGGQPLGRAVGPALEAREALRALYGSKSPASLIEKATAIAGILLELGGKAPKGQGQNLAKEILHSGRALEKMKQIIRAQGGNPEIKPEDVQVGNKTATFCATADGYVTHIDNKLIIQIARAVGAPKDKGAGLILKVKRGRRVAKGDPLIEIYAESESKLTSALNLAQKIQPMRIEGMLLKRVPEIMYVEE
ncbi:MAG: AMP phosphorylase [Euryarchaeota archaeon]|nr:AMP phosphorylase [Euryarchaeota archaeon]